SGRGAGGAAPPADLVFRKDLWQRAAESGGIETRRRVVPADAVGHQKLVELAHGRNSASERSWRERRRGCKIRVQGGCISGLGGLRSGAKEPSEVAQIVAVRGQCQHGGAAFGSQHL